MATSFRSREGASIINLTARRPGRWQRITNKFVLGSAAMRLILCILLAIGCLAGNAYAADELVLVRSHEAGAVAYVLTTGGSTPAYAVILMPGGNGIPDPRMTNGGLKMRA